MATLGTLVIDLLLKAGSFETDMGRAARLSDKAAKQFDRDAKLIGKAIGGAIAGVAVGLTALVTAQIRAADAARETAQKVGISVESLTSLQYAAKQSGLEVGTLQMGLTQLNKRLADAAGGGKYSKLFTQLGIDIKSANGELKGSDTILRELAVLFSTFKEGPEKSALAMQLMGKAGTSVLPLLTKELATTEERAARLGLVISTQTAEAADKFGDRLQDVTGLTQGFGNMLAERLLPSLNLTLEAFADGATQSGIFEKAAGGVVTVLEAIGLFAMGTYGAIRLVGTAIAGIVDSISRIKDLGIGETLADYAKGASQILSGNRLGGFLTLRNASRESERKGREATKGMGDSLKAELASQAAAFAAWDKAINGSTSRVGKDFLSVKGGAVLATPPIIKFGKDTADAMSKAAKEAEKLAKAYQRLIEAEDEYLASVEDDLAAAFEQAGRKIEDMLTDEQQRLNVARLFGKEQQDYLDTLELQAIEKQANEGLDEQQIKQADHVLRLEKLKLTAMERQRAEKERMYALERAQGLGAFGGITRNAGTPEQQTEAFQTVGQFIFGGLEEVFKRGADGFEDAVGGLVDALKKPGNRAEVVGQVANSITATIASFRALRQAGYDTAGSLLEIVTRSAESSGNVYAQAAAATVRMIDAFAGGRLLGTPYATTGASRNFGIGAGGITGSSSITQERQRSFFRGRQTRTNTTPLDAQAQESLSQYLRSLQLAVASASRTLGQQAPALIAGSFLETFDKDGNLLTQVGTIAGRRYSETAESFQRRLTAENIIAVSALLDSTATQIADRWRSSSYTLLEGAQFLLAAQAAIRGGSALLPTGTLTETVDLIESIAIAGEPLVEVFARAQVSTLLLTEALGLMGQNLGRSRADIVRFAVGIADAAGGVERAATLWEAYFNTFYSAGERAQAQLTQARGVAADRLAGLGLDTNIDPAVFRTLFEAGLATFTAEQTATWLLAAEAIANATNAQAAYAEILDATAGELRDFMREIDSGFRDLGGLTLAEQFEQIALDMDDAIIRARELGATEEQLTRIRLLSARRARELIAATEASARGIIERLYPTDVAAGLGQVANGIEAIGIAISSFRDNALIDSSLSPLSVQGQYEEAIAQLARTGDEGTARRALELARQLRASGQDYEDAFNLITSMTRQQSQAVGDIAGGEAPGLSQLERTREATTLADYIAQLAEAQQQTFDQVSERLGVSLGDLARDLGLENVDALRDYLLALQIDEATITQGESEMIVLLGRIADILSGRFVNVTPTGAGGKPTSPGTAFSGPYDGPFDPAPFDPIPVDPFGATPPGQGPIRPPRGAPPIDPFVRDTLGKIAADTESYGSATVAAVNDLASEVRQGNREERGRNSGTRSNAVPA